MRTMGKCSTPSTATPPLRVSSTMASGSASGLSRSNWSAASLSSALSGTSGLTGSQSLTALAAIPEGRPSGGERMRRFSSRHVPMVAEDIAYQEVLTPTMVVRFNGLMKYLKCNSPEEESQKQVIAAGSPDALVPPEQVLALQAEYSRRCAFGERMNLELMSSAKWIRLLEDIELLIPCPDAPVSPKVGAGGTKPRPAAFRSNDTEASTSEADAEPLALGEGFISRWAADLVFTRIMHNCYHGGKRLDYELFCKALLLAGHIMWPGQELEAVLVHLVSRIIESSPQPAALSPSEQAKDDLVASANIGLALSCFEPALCDLFQACCTSKLINPGSPSHGRGLVRIQERPVYKASMPGSPLSSVSPSPTASARRRRSSGGGMSLTAALADLSSRQAAVAAAAVAASEVSTPREEQSLLSAECTRNSTAASPLAPLPIVSRSSCAETVGRALCAVQGPMSPMAVGGSSPKFSPMSSASPGHFANGSPVVANRRQVMSLDQFMSLCRQLNATPELLTRNEVVRIFKRAELESMGPTQSTGLHGLLSLEAFIDAMGQVALEAYSKEPYCEEYPEVHDRIHAFLSSALPSKTRKTNDRFLYGRGW